MKDEPGPERNHSSAATLRKEDPSGAQENIWNLPNQLTLARLLLSVVFFILLAIERAPGNGTVVLNIATALFILAVVTDVLDGYLARKWGLTSTFGRIADPFADKIVVCGGFIMLTGVAPGLVEPWYPVVIMFREFLVSGLRSFLESRGVPFGAAFSGKLKMIVQSITIPSVLIYQANLSGLKEGSAWSWAKTAGYWFTVGALVITLILTVLSSVGYVQRAVQLIRLSASRGVEKRPD